MSVSARIAVVLFFVCLAPGLARADDLAVGGQAVFGSEVHVEPGLTATAHDPLPFVVLDAHIKRFEIQGELVPPITGLTQSTVGLHNITLSYFDGSVRYWTAGRKQWCVGIGQVLWNQQTEYLYRYLPAQYDASRGAGMRYEIGSSIPVFKRDRIETILGASPTIHARLSYTFGAPGYFAMPVSEQESQVTAQVALVQPAGRWRFKYGLVYMNMTAKFDDGGFADANHVAGVFVTALYTLSASR